MALTPRSGFSNTTTGQNDIPDEIPNTQSDVLNNMPFVTDTNLNKYAIDTTAYPNTTKMLVGFMKGKRVPVTYYRQLRRGGSNIRTNIADYATTRNVLDAEFQKIINLEITLPKGFDFEANPESASVGVTGEAQFYPNMNPSVGDVFTMGVGDGRIGVFQVSSAVPTSWRTDRIYFVKFVLQSFMDASDSDPIEGSVTLVSVFSKENYFGGTAALLSEQTYLSLQRIKAQRGVLCKYYHQTFYDKDISTYMRPDGLYDPSAVYFMANKLSMQDVHVRPKNLMGNNLHDYNQTIWNRLEDRYNTTLYGVATRYVVMPTVQSRMGVFNTELWGRGIIAPVLLSQTPPDSDILYSAIDGNPLTSAVKNDSLYTAMSAGDYYLFSAEFYNGVTDEMSTEELRIYNAIALRNAGDLSSLISDYLDPVYTLPLDDQYYKIPLYIHLIDMALQSQYREIDAPSMSYTSQGEQ